MKLGKIFLGLALSFLLTACSATKGNEITNNLTTSFSNTTTTIEKNVYINNFSSDIKTTGVVNPCMGFYRTRYLNLKRSGVEVYDDFEENGFYHLRVDISDFSSATNNEADYEITDDALQKLETYLYYANNKRCSIIIRFAYDEYKGKENMEPSIPMMVKHIEKLSSVINQYKDLLVAIECGLIGPWGEMHTSVLSIQSTYNVLLEAWLNNVETLPILSRKPVFVYEYLGYNYSNLDTFELDETNNRLGVFNDGYYGTIVDSGTYESLDARIKETNFLGKLITPFGGEVIGEPTNLFTIDEVLAEMDLVGLSYLNLEWDDNLVNSWRDKEYNGQSFYDYMVNHLGFKLYVESIATEYKAGVLKIDVNLANMGFNNIYEELTVDLYIKTSNELIHTYKKINDNDLKVSLEAVTDDSNAELYISIKDNALREYELMNGKYSNGKNYLGDLVIE